MKIAFLGTPEFALPSLEMLFHAGHELAVYTQPDRPRDRGHGLAMPPVKVFAIEKGLKVYQYEKLKSSEGVESLRSFEPDLMVTAAFGQLLSKENLDVPKYGCINVHGSLLPKYRGAAPIQWAIINGEKVTGVTTMMTDVGLDTGDILLRQAVEIDANETYGGLYSRLAVIGADLLKRTIENLENGSLERIRQDESEATKCTVIKKEHALIDFGKRSADVHNLVRGLNPAPIAYTVLDGVPVKIYRTILRDELSGIEGVDGECVIADAKRGLCVKTGDGAIEIAELQFPGSKRMEAKAVLNGRKLLGAVFSK